MHFLKATLFALLSATALASPTRTLHLRKRQNPTQSQCGQYETITASPYTLQTDLWGINQGSGSQCSTLKGKTGNSVSWSTNWSWSGASSQVKSYTNVGLNMASTQLSNIKSIPTSWSWAYSGSGMVADVAYDMFTSASANGEKAFEIMVWLAALGGAMPISTGGQVVATPTIGGTSFKLYSGPNQGTTVYSFVAANTAQNFSGDLNGFFNYLETSQGFSKSQYLLSVQAGTEAFTGSGATLTTTSYTCALNA